MNKFFLVLLGCVTVVSGCSVGRQHQDLHDFMEQARKAPGGEVEPLPTFSGYKTYRYSALALRSPFEVPIPESLERNTVAKSSVQPNENRQKEFLEGFNLASFSLVGSLSKDGRLWSLINDGEGGIHRVAEGDYLGKNHGRVVSSTTSRLELIEIVPDGKGKWLERPRTLALNN